MQQKETEIDPSMQIKDNVSFPIKTKIKAGGLGTDRDWRTQARMEAELSAELIARHARGEYDELDMRGS